MRFLRLVCRRYAENILHLQKQFFEKSTMQKISSFLTFTALDLLLKPVILTFMDVDTLFEVKLNLDCQKYKVQTVDTCILCICRLLKDISVHNHVLQWIVLAKVKTWQTLLFRYKWTIFVVVSTRSDKCNRCFWRLHRVYLFSAFTFFTSIIQ